MLGAMASHYMDGFKSGDVLYTALPLYHSVANIIGIGQALLFGVPVAFRRKFSATYFWQDCVRFEVTVSL
jgi:solute carrier family 27 fatty acid transporter 1/4